MLSASACCEVSTHSSLSTAAARANSHKARRGWFHSYCRSGVRIHTSISLCAQAARLAAALRAEVAARLAAEAALAAAQGELARRARALAAAGAEGERLRAGMAAAAAQRDALAATLSAQVLGCDVM